MGVGFHRWWSAELFERACKEYSARFDEWMNMYYAPGARERLATILEDTYIGPPRNVRRIGARDLVFSKVQSPGEISGPEPIECGDRETAERLAAIFNAPLTEDQKRRACLLRETMKSGTVLLASTPAGPSAFLDGIEFIADERLGPDEAYLLPTTAWRNAVNLNKESNVAKASAVEMKVLQEISVDSSGIRNGDAIFVGGVRFVAERFDRLPDRSCFDHDECRGAVKCQRVKKSGNSFAQCAHCRTPMACTPLRLVDGREMHPGCWAKIDPTQPLVKSTGSVAFDSARPTAAGRLAMATELAENKAITPAQYMDVLESGRMPDEDVEDEFVVGPKWKVKRDEGRDALVFFDTTDEFKSVIIGYELIRQAARDFVLSREKTERGGALRRRISEAVGEASTLFQGPGGVFDTERAIEITERIARDIELGPGLASRETGVTWEAGPPRQGEPGRIGDQLRNCHGCDKEQKVDDFNLSIAPHASVGVFGDAEDLYVCDACAPDVLKAVRRVRDGKAPARGEAHDIDNMADDE